MVSNTKLTPYDAAMLVTLSPELEEEEILTEAWQVLHDSGLAYQLEGWIGRQAQHLIKEGYIHE